MKGMKVSRYYLRHDKQRPTSVLGRKRYASLQLKRETRCLSYGCQVFDIHSIPRRRLMNTCKSLQLPAYPVKKSLYVQKNERCHQPKYQRSKGQTSPCTILVDIHPKVQSIIKQVLDVLIGVTIFFLLAWVICI